VFLRKCRALSRKCRALLRECRVFFDGTYSSDERDDGIGQGVGHEGEFFCGNVGLVCRM